MRRWLLSLLAMLPFQAQADDALIGIGNIIITILLSYQI